MRVTAILASYNRRSQTVACLTSYYTQDVGSNVTLAAVLVDDGSVDGTAQAVRDQFPEVQVVVGSGNLFWAGAMALAEQVALAQDPDYLLWLNDDVVLDPDALRRLIETASREPDGCIAVGALREPATGEVTYSGVRRRGRHPFRLDRVAPADEPVKVETFNGNVVLVPRLVATRIGPIDGALVHASADFDYGLRAADAGVPNLLAPGIIGTCALNPYGEPWLDRSLPVRQRLRHLLGPKGFPPRARARYLMRHAGPAWFLYWLAPYIRTAPSIVRPVIRGRGEDLTRT
jgi:GT2 family glycosyltransferase